MPAEDIVQNWETWQFANLRSDDRWPKPDGFWMRFFPTPFYSDKEEIYFEDLPVDDRRMAPFVLPHMQGRVMRAPEGPGLRSFRPAYVKPKHEVSPYMAVPRQPGEPLGGSLSLQEKYNRILADRAMSQDQMIRRRWDFMAAQAVIYAQTTVSGEDYPAVTINFRRSANLTNALTGSARWSQNGSNPLEDIAEMRGRGLSLGRSPINDIIMGSTAASNFLAFAGLKDLVDLRYRQPGTANFNTSGFRTGEPVESIGTYMLPDGGTVNFWKFENSYVDPMTGNTVDLLSPVDVVGVGAGLQGVRAFGAIKDRRAGFAATDMFTKNWDEEDPSRSWVMTQSAPLMVPANPDNSFRLTTE